MTRTGRLLVLAGALSGGACAPTSTTPAATTNATTGVTTAAPPQKAEAPMQKKEPRVTRIEETTVATIDGWKVTVGNVMRGRWRLPDGSEREGMSAEVGLYDEAKAPRGEPTVGEGAVLEIAGRRWTVVRVVAGQGGGNGSIELREAE